jgi:Spy/CpxP family protein refolding chaperone
MPIKRKFTINRVRLIEGVSIAAGLATLLSTSESLIGAKGTAAPTEKQVTHPISMPAPTRSSGVRKVATAEILGEPDISNDQFDRLVASETTLIQALPPLVAQLHKDRAYLKILESTHEIDSSHLAQMRSKLLNDKEAIARLMIESQQENSEILKPEQQDKLNRILTNG